eukprot:UN30182
MIIRLIPGIEDALLGEGTDAANVLNVRVMDVKYREQKWVRRFGWLAHSGMIVLWVALATPFIVPYNQINPDTEKVSKTELQSFRDINYEIERRKLKRAHEQFDLLHTAALKIKAHEAAETPMWERRKFALKEGFR